MKKKKTFLFAQLCRGRHLVCSCFFSESHVLCFYAKKGGITRERNSRKHTNINLIQVNFDRTNFKKSAWFRDLVYSSGRGRAPACSENDER